MLDNPRDLKVAPNPKCSKNPKPYRPKKSPTNPKTSNPKTQNVSGRLVFFIFWQLSFSSLPRCGILQQELEDWGWRSRKEQRLLNLLQQQLLMDPLLMLMNAQSSCAACRSLFRMPRSIAIYLSIYHRCILCFVFSFLGFFPLCSVLDRRWLPPSPPCNFM